MRVKRVFAYASGAALAIGLNANAFAENWDAGAGKDWPALLAAGQKEGQVVVSLCPGGLTDTIGKSFTADTGINVNFVTGSVADLASKFDTEMKSGRVQTDIRLSGVSTLPYVSQGQVVSLADKLMLPNVTTPTDWVTGKLGWLDNGQKYIPVPAEYVGATAR